MPAPNFPPLPRVTHPKPPGQTDRLPTLPGPWLAGRPKAAVSSGRLLRDGFPE